MNDQEGVRISTVYRARKKNGLDQLYAPYRPEVVYERAIVDLAIARELERVGLYDRLASARVLDVGCGRGRQLRTLIEWGATPTNLHGIDVFEDDISIAGLRSPAGVQFVAGNAEQMPHADETFDLIIANTLMSSILDVEIRKNVCREIARVLRADGIVIIYDFIFSNPQNENVRPVKRKELVKYFRGWDVRGIGITMAPPLSRVLGRFGMRCVSFFDAFCPWFRSHRLYIVTPRLDALLHDPAPK